jgi:hypothetical protein
MQNNPNQLFTFKFIDPNMTVKLLEGFTDKWFRIQNKGAGKCLKFNQANGRLISGECAESDETAWQIVPNKDDQSYLVLSKKGNFVLDNEAARNNNGNPVLTYSTHKGNNQRWFIVPWGLNTWRFVEKNTGKSLDLSGGDKSNGAVYQLWDSMRDNQNQGFVFLPMGEKVKIRGYIKNAINNEVIPTIHLNEKKVSIKFNSGKESFSAKILEGGQYEVSLPKGSYNRIVSLEKFSNMNQAINVAGESTESNASNTLFVSPVINGWRVVLTWNAAPKDLDLHMWLPGNEDVNYNNKLSHDKLVQLDVDNTTGLGPETISLKEIKEGIYKAYVHNYSQEAPLSASGAKVVVFHGSELVQEIKINPAAHNPGNNWWHVLNIDATNQKVIVVNEVKIAEI